MTKFIVDLVDPIENEQRDSGVNVLQFWSGGADSTYLFLQNLLCGHNVTATYVNIRNNRTKCTREQTARKLLQKDIEKFCNYFHCQKPIYLPDHEIYVKGESFGHCPAPQQIIFAMFALLIGRPFDTITLGVVNGDSMQGSTLNKDFIEAYTKHFLGKFPTITYPIEDVSKEAIYLTLQGYDNTIGTSFLKHITVCESVDEPCGKVKNCLPCQTQYEVFKRLKWVK